MFHIVFADRLQLVVVHYELGESGGASEHATHAR